MDDSPQLLSIGGKIFVDTFLKEKLMKNYSIDVAPAVARGKNYLGDVARIVVSSKSDDYNEEAVLKIILKSAPQNKIMRSLCAVEKLFEREIYLYQHVLPHFMKMQQEKNIKCRFASFAQCYKTSLEHLNEALILEDLEASGFRMNDCFKQLDYSHVLFVIKEYGRFHALSYAMRDTQPELFQRLSENIHDRIFHSSTDQLKSEMGRITCVLNTLDPIRDRVAHCKLLEYQRSILVSVSKGFPAELVGQYAVITHGDCWINNFLFKYDNDAPSEMRFLDWQFSRLGSPALDLSYFLFSCTSEALRHDHFYELINEYYRSLSSSLREFGCDPKKLLPFHVLQDHLRIFSVHSLNMVITLLFFGTLKDDEALSFSSSESVEDFYNVVKIRDTSRIDVYNSRVRAVILDFVKFGFEFSMSCEI